MGFPGGSVVKNPPASTGGEGDGFNPWIRKISWMKEMAILYRTLASRIPWTEAPGGLQSTGSQRVRHDLPRTQAVQPYVWVTCKAVHSSVRREPRNFTDGTRSTMLASMVTSYTSPQYH